MSQVEEQDTQLSGETSLLIVDDEANLRNQLAKAMERRGFTTEVAETVAEGKRAVGTNPPKYAVIDLRLDDGSGLEVVEALRESRPDARIIVLTGYGNIATAVAAVKAGALDYLPKPADADQVAAALLAEWDSMPPPPNVRCLPTGSDGSISSAYTNNATAMFRRRRAA